MCTLFRIVFTKAVVLETVWIRPCRDGASLTSRTPLSDCYTNDPVLTLSPTSFILPTVEKPTADELADSCHTHASRHVNQYVYGFDFVLLFNDLVRQF